MLRKSFRLCFFLGATLALSPKLTHAQTYAQSVLYSFCDQSSSSCPNGTEPYGGLVLAPDGNFYGTTSTGGANNNGTVFKLTPNGTLTTIYSFCSQGGSNCTDGSSPLATLLVGPDGNFYGTTAGNGSNIGGLGGTVFKVTPSGTLTTLYRFCSLSDCSDGRFPASALVQGPDEFYGTTESGGLSNEGTAFSITSSGGFTSLYSFCSQGGTNCTDGQSPHASLLLGTDGNLYGETEAGGAVSNYGPGEGTAFKLTPSGALTTLTSFCDVIDCYNNGQDVEGGQEPTGGLVEVGGNFYGTTLVGGPCGGGTVFEMTPSGAVTTLADLCGEYNGPYAALVPGTDGNLYGTTVTGGTNNSGSVFQLTLSGALTTLYNFCAQGGEDCTDGQVAQSSVVQGTDGNFYGTTSYGGEYDTNGSGGGTIYKISVSPALPAPVQLSLQNSSISLGDNADVSFSVLNAFSTTMQQCYGFSTLNGVTTPLGKVTGTLSNGIYSGSATFTPTADGTYSLALTCGGVESGFATLTVTGSSEPITFTSVTHNFGSLQVGNSGSYGVKVTNPNAFAFPFHLTLTGPSTFTEATNCGSSIPGNGSCQIEFYFAPTSATTQTATWSLTSNSATFSPSNGGTLTGTGVLNGSLNYTTSVHNFGTYTVGTDSPVYGTVLTNSYNFPVTLGYTTSGSTTSFSLLTNCGATLAAGQSCNADFTFTPKATGFVTETVGVTASYKGSPIAVTSLGQTITGITLKGTGQ